MSRLGLAIALLVAPADAMSRKPRMDKSMETHGTYSSIDKPGYRLVTTAQQWKTLWSELKRPAPAEADFARHFAVAAFAGTRESGGFGIVFDKPVAEKDVLVIRYVITRPKGMATMALTQPYAVKFFPKSEKPVRVEGREE